MLRQFSKYSFSKSKQEMLSIIKMELSENPEFEKAFPNLKDYKPQTEIPINHYKLDFMESLK